MTIREYLDNLKAGTDAEKIAGGIIDNYILTPGQGCDDIDDIDIDEISDLVEEIQTLKKGGAIYSLLKDLEEGNF